MAKSTQGAASARRSRDPDGVREALLEAGKRLLAERPPSAIAAREIAAEAGVNYGFVHHYFGGKADLLRAAMLALRDDFLLHHPRPEELSLLTGERDPFLAGLGRSQMDYPNELGGLDVNLIGSQLVAAIRASRSRRVRQRR